MRVVAVPLLRRLDRTTMPWYRTWISLAKASFLLQVDFAFAVWGDDLPGVVNEVAIF